MTPNELRAEAAAVDYEESTDCTTRACLLRGAADEIERLRAILEDILMYVEELSGDAFRVGPAVLGILENKCHSGLKD